jgi:hypothetical protein
MGRFERLDPFFQALYFVQEVLAGTRIVGHAVVSVGQA